MSDETRPRMPAATVETLARSVFEQAARYGFTRIDQVRLASALLSLCNAAGPAATGPGQKATATAAATRSVPTPPSGVGLAHGARLVIHALDASHPHFSTVAGWLQELFAAHFLLSAASPQSRNLEELLRCDRNVFGLACLDDGRPAVLLAYLDHDELHQRAEMRVLVGDPGLRRQGYAEEAARAWLAYGFGSLGLGKVFAQTLQGDVRTMQLFERLGFAVEAVLPGELCIAGERHAAVRCALLRDAYVLPADPPPSA